MRTCYLLKFKQHAHMYTLPYMSNSICVHAHVLSPHNSNSMLACSPYLQQRRGEVDFLAFPVLSCLPDVHPCFPLCQSHACARSRARVCVCVCVRVCKCVCMCVYMCVCANSVHNSAPACRPCWPNPWSATTRFSRAVIGCQSCRVHMCMIVCGCVVCKCLCE